MQIPELIVFDIDNTIAVSKLTIDIEMAQLISQLLLKTKVGIMSGESFPETIEQVVKHLDPKSKFTNLFIISASGSEMYTYLNDEWQKVYAYLIPEEGKKKIFDSFQKVAGLSASDISTHLQDRNSEVTYYGLKRGTFIEDKVRWDPDHSKRKALVAKLQPLLPEFELTIRGTTSIDVTQKGVNKGLGMKRISEELALNPQQTLYVGDALFDGGNDAPVKEAGFPTYAVKNPIETKQFIDGLLDGNIV